MLHFVIRISNLINSYLKTIKFVTSDPYTVL